MVAVQQHLLPNTKPAVLTHDNAVNIGTIDGPEGLTWQIGGQYRITPKWCPGVEHLLQTLLLCDNGRIQKQPPPWPLGRPRTQQFIAASRPELMLPES